MDQDPDLMDMDALSPRESLNLITDILQEAKERQEQNGIIYIFWGILVAGVSLAQFILQEMGMYHWIFLAYMIIPLGVVVNYFAFPRYRERGTANFIGQVVGVVWIFAAANMMILGFALYGELTKHLSPFIMILLGLALGASGYLLKVRILFYAGILANVVGLICFWVPLNYHPLTMASVSMISVFLPGVILNRAFIARKHV